MNRPAQPRPPGRPRRVDAVLGQDQILAAAMDIVTSGSGEVSMRGVAAALGVNAMALYHYFDSKQALHDALVERAFQPLQALPKRLDRLPPGEARLRLLAETYLRCAAQALALTRYLARQGGQPLTGSFHRLFVQALGHPTAMTDGMRLASDVLVDYLHGAALAGTRAARRALASAWPVLMRGLLQALA